MTATALSLRRSSGAFGPTGSIHALTDPDIVTHVLARCAEQRASGTLTDVSGASLVRPCLLVHYDDGSLTIQLEQDTLARLSGPMVITFSLHGVRFEVRGLVEGEAPFVVMRAPMRLYCIARRRVRRAELPSGAATFVWNLVDANNPEERQAPVLDLAPGGIRITTPVSVRLPKGLFAAGIRTGDDTIPTMARITHERFVGGEIEYGVALDAGKAHARVVELYVQHRFPRCIWRRNADAKAVTELMFESGYLALREGTTPSDQWMRLDCSPQLSGDLVYRSETGESIGHFSITRYFSRTWLIQQLAVAPKHAEKDAVKLAAYHFFASYPWIADGEGGHFLGYYDRKKRWHQMFFERFVRWIDDEALACINLLDRFERDSQELPPAPAPRADVEVGPPTEAEIPRTVAIIRAQMSELHAEALDIHPDRLTTPHLHELFADSGHTRARQALVLRYRGDLVGVALCEHGSRDMSLFNLFNIATLYFVTDRSKVPDEVKLHLMAAVRRFYAERGELNPLVVAPEGTLPGELEPGTKLAETMGCLLFSEQALLQYECFVDFEFGHHMQKRGRAKA